MDHHVPDRSNYTPLIVVAGFILGGTAVLSTIVPNTDALRAVMFFEGLMLTFFSLFKLMNVPAFQEAYANYDLIAQKVPAWGYLYPFLELTLGTTLLLNFQTQAASLAIGLLSIIGLIGVTIELKKDRQFQCACLGTALNVPLTKVTLYENAIMLALAAVMLFA